MYLVNFFLTALSVFSVFSSNSIDNKEVPEYKKVLSVRTPRYKTLEITTTPKYKYYYAPSYNKKPAYKKLTLTPKITPTITFPPAVIKTVSPTQASSANLSREDYILSEINNYRQSKGLPKSKPDSNTCGFAKLRAQEISGSFNHDEFTNRINSKTLPYPSYSAITENISMNSDYKQVAQKWIESSGHAANIEKDTPFICVGSSGNYYTMQGWKP